MSAIVDWSKVSGEEKVRICIEMTDFVREVCVAGIRASRPDVSDEEVVEELRRRFSWNKRRL